MSVNLSIFLSFNGNCAEAMAFYADVFKASPGRVMKYGDAPGGSEFSETSDKIMYGEMLVGNLNLMFSDMPQERFVAGNNFTMNYVCTDHDEVHRVFEAMKEGGSVMMPPQKTFFSELYSMVTDRFGVNWNIMA